MSKPRYYHVQIAHWGYVPILNRRGPIANCELTKEQIEELRDVHGIKLLDPYNGKDFEFPDEVVPGAIGAYKKDVEEIPTDDEPGEPAETETDGDDSETEETETETAETETSGTTFNPEWIPGFASLSKNKQKKLRARYSQLAANSTVDAAQIPAMLRTYLEELQKNG